MKFYESSTLRVEEEGYWRLVSRQSKHERRTTFLTQFRDRALFLCDLSFDLLCAFAVEETETTTT
jgi:hypothetical protein